MEPNETQSIMRGVRTSVTSTITHIRLARNLNAEQLVRQRIDGDEDITELCRYDTSSVISAVLRPNYVDFVVTQVPHLKERLLVSKIRLLTLLI